jgi:uncharacterized protein
MLRTGQALRATVRCCRRYPKITVLVAVVLTVLAVPVTLMKLSFETSNLHLLPSGQPYVARYREYAQQFGELDEIIIAIHGQTPDESKAFAARLVASLHAGPTRFTRLAYRVSPESLDGRALLYLPTETLTQIRDQIFDHQAFIESFAASPGLVTLIDAVDRDMTTAFAAHVFDLGLGDDTATGDLQFLATLLTQMRERIEGTTPYRSPWGSLLASTDADDDGYFFSDNRRLLLVLADPVSKSGSSFTGDRDAIEDIRQRISKLRPAFPGVEAGVTGGPALDNDAMTNAFADSTVATALAFALTIGLLLAAFRRVVQPLVMLAVLAMSLVWSIAFVALTIGHLTVFSVMFISIVIGLGIDYGIYVLVRYDEERARRASPAEALDVTAAWTGPGILLGALTAAATFYALLLTDFHGVQELGFVAGSALLMAFVAMLTVFPALLVLTDRPRPAGGPPPPRSTAAPERTGALLIGALRRHPTIVLLIAALLTLLSLRAVGRVKFDYNLLNLQARGTESVLWERQILDNHGRTSFSALATASSAAELRRKRDAFQRLPSVAAVDSALLLIPDDQPLKQKMIGDFAPLVEGVRVGSPPALDLNRLTGALQRLRRRLDVIAVEAGPDSAGHQVEEIRAGLRELTRALGREPIHVVSALTAYQARLASDFAEKLGLLRRNTRPPAVTAYDLPAELRRKFVSDSGLLLIQIHPKVDIWDRAGAIQFVEEIRSVDPAVTGAPVITYESILRMETAYRQGALYAFLVVAVISGLMIRRLRETVLALTPLALGTLWGIGLMYVCGLPFNLANVWGAPLIIGASAEYGLNIIIRFLEAQAHGGPLIAPKTMMAVTLNGLTTISGFGCLLIAHHRGIWSLGLLLTIGSATSLAASLIVLPALIYLFAGGHDEPTRSVA